jgi:hypothetical protein
MDRKKLESVFNIVIFSWLMAMSIGLVITMFLLEPIFPLLHYTAVGLPIAVVVTLPIDILVWKKRHVIYLWVDRFYNFTIPENSPR